MENTKRRKKHRGLRPPLSPQPTAQLCNLEEAIYRGRCRINYFSVNGAKPLYIGNQEMSDKLRNG